AGAHAERNRDGGWTDADRSVGERAARGRFRDLAGGAREVGGTRRAAAGVCLRSRCFRLTSGLLVLARPPERSLVDRPRQVGDELELLVGELVGGGPDYVDPMVAEDPILAAITD